MKIAIPSDDGNNISLHFGRCYYFIIYEIEGEKVKNRTVRDNIYCTHRAGICPREMKKQDKIFVEEHRESVLHEIKDCDLVIGSYINPILKKNFQEHNIKFMVVDEKIADDTIQKYIDNALVVNKGNKNICEKQSCNLNCLNI